MSRLNKTTAAVISGAVVSIVGAFFDPAPEILAAAQTLLTAALVWLVPNGGTDHA